MAQTAQQIKLAKTAEQAVRAKQAPTAIQAKHAQRAAQAIHLDTLKQAQQYNKNQVETFLSNYNDPTELNSFIDALTNREAVSKKYGDTWGTLSTLSGQVSALAFATAIGAAALAPVTGGASLSVAAAAAKVGSAAALPAVPAAVDVTVEKGIKPILAGKPKEAGLNMLMNLGETMDFTSNPVKGLLQEGVSGFLKGTGLSSEGRKNYDWDTGSFITNMLLEVVSDPLNWVEFGANAIGKNAIKSVAETQSKNVVNALWETTNTAYAKVLGEISEEGREAIQNTMTKTLSNISKEYNEKLINKASKESIEQWTNAAKQRIQQSLTRAIRKELPELSATEIDIIMQRTGRNIISEQLAKEAYQQIQDLSMDALTNNVIKATSAMTHYSNAWQKFMNKGALYSSGFGGTIELAKKGFKPLAEWATNSMRQRMVKANVADMHAGIHPDKYTQAKNMWVQGGEYTSALLREQTTDTLDTFYQAMQQQLNRDKDIVRGVIYKYPNDAIKQAAELDGIFNNMYGYDFKKYAEYLVEILNSENGKFSDAINYITNAIDFIENGVVNQQNGVKLLDTTGMYKIKDLTDLANNVGDLTEQLNKITESKPKIKAKLKKELGENIYQLQVATDQVNAILFNDIAVTLTMQDLSSSGATGKYIDNFLNGVKTIANDTDALKVEAFKTIRRTTNSFNNIYDMYAKVGALALPAMEGINDTTLKQYIINAIMGTGVGHSTTELMESFEIRLKDIQYSLSQLSNNVIDFENNPALMDQIGQVYKEFVEAQYNAGITDIRTTIDKNFINSLKALDNAQEYTPAIKSILTTFDSIDTINNALFNSTTSSNILNILNEAYDTSFSYGLITDAGLALKTVADKDNYKIFNIPEGITNADFEAMNTYGRKVNSISKRIEENTTHFTNEYNTRIEEAYEKWYAQMVENPESETLSIIKNLKRAETPYSKFAQMSVHADTVNSNYLLRKEFSTTIKDKQLFKDLVNPNKILVTDYAMDAMQLNNIAAGKRLREDVINVVNNYKSLGTLSAKATNNFQELRNTISNSGFDEARKVYLEQYIKSCSNINDFMIGFDNWFDTLFDNKAAENAIENMRSILIEFPELYEKYNTLLDNVERYWSGDLTFTQPAKWDTSGTIEDTFTPFYISIQEMNKDIQEAMDKYNTNLYNTYKANIKKFDKNELKIRRIKKGFSDKVYQDYVTEINEFNNKLYKDYTDSKIQSASIDLYAPVKKQVELNKMIQTASSLDSQKAIYNVVQFTPEQLQKELAFRHRFITFTDNDLNKNTSKMFNKLKEDAKLKELGINIVHNDGRYWIVLDKSVKINAEGNRFYLNSNLILRDQAKHTFEGFKAVDKHMQDLGYTGQNMSEILDQFSTAAKRFTGSELGDSQGDYLTKDSIRKVYNQMPEEVKNLLDVDDLLDQQFYNTYMFNESVLGNSTSKAKLGVYTGNMIQAMNSSMTQMQGYVHPKTEYINTVFDSYFNIANSEGVYNGFSDAELYEALQLNPDYKLVALVNDKKYGVHVQEILPVSVEAITDAKRLGAVVVPLQVYKDMYNTVNHRIGSTGASKFWARLIYMYKSGYLMRPGAMIRNFIDTNLKTMLNTEGQFKYYKQQAHSILNDIDAAQAYAREKYAHNITEGIYDEFGNTISRDALVKEWLDMHNGLSYEDYRELCNKYLGQSVSDNIMADLYDTTSGGLWGDFTKATGTIIEAGNQTERYNRLAQYLYFMDKGYDNTSALAKLSKIHFDYGFKSKAEQLVDLIFPFTTFSLRNYSFWLGMLENNPWILRNYTHIMKPAWDFKDFTRSQLATNAQLQNQILSGYLPLTEFNNKKIMFKANPSVQNALMMFSDPVNAVYDRLAAPISTPIKLTQGEMKPTFSNIAGMVPVVGPAMQAASTIFTKANPVPSALSVTNRRRQKTTSVKFTNKNYAGINSFKDKQYNRPNYQKNIVYDAYKTKGITRYRTNFYPVIDVAYQIKSKYSVNVYAKIKNKVQTDVFKGIRYRIRLDGNRWR